MSPTKKIAELPVPCRHPEHNPPMHRLFEPGLWEHTCPGCGAKMHFTVPRFTWSGLVDYLGRVGGVRSW